MPLRPAEGSDAERVDVVADHRDAGLGEGDGQRQADVAQPDDAR